MYRSFWGYVVFFAIFVAFILITSLQERGLVAPTGYHATAIYTLAMYTGDGDEKSSIFISTWLLDGWDMPLVELSL